MQMSWITSNLLSMSISKTEFILKAVAVLGFCVWGANGAGIFVWGVKWGLSAEGAKLRLPKARSPSRLGGLGKRRKLPQRGLCVRQCPEPTDDVGQRFPNFVGCGALLL